MNRTALRTLAVLAGLSLSMVSAFAENPPAPAKSAAPAAKTPADPSVPAIKGNPDDPKNAFLVRHEMYVKTAKAGGVDVLFEGDSITAGWAGGGKEVWAKTYAPIHAANFGIGGDQTQHVLWRIENGELDGITPKVTVLMIGTNNLGGNPSDEAIAGGITTIVKTLHAKLPETKVLLLGVFPRGQKADDRNRARIKHINEIISKLDDGKATRYLDIGDKFLEPDGSISKEVMKDFLHPTAKGYQIWADAMKPLLEEMMK